MQLLLQRWKDPESGLDSAEAFTYEVLLSFPSQEQPNVVDIGEVLPSLGNAQRVGGGKLLGPAMTLPPPPTVGPTGDIIHSCHRTEENVTGEQGGPDVVQPYAAYAPSGTPQVGPEPPYCPGPGPLFPPRVLPTLTQGTCLNWGTAPPPEFTHLDTPSLLLSSISHSTNTSGSA